MAKNYFNRYVWLIDTIQKHGHITFEELSDAWQRSALNEDGSYLPERTFFNHREAIKDIFGIEFKFDKSLGYSLVCDDLNADGIREWLLTSLSVNNMIKESSELRHRILFENIPSGREYLHAIIDAMKDNEILEISYKRFTDAQEACFEIAPYCVKLYKQRWYVVCKPCGDRNISIYSLDRIQNLRKTGRFFKMPVKFDAAEYFAQYFGIVHDESYPVGTIRLKVTASQRHYFRTLPLHSSQQETQINDEYSIFEYYMAPTWDFERELMQYFEQVEVLEPECLRDMMIEHAWEMLHLYKEA